MISIVAIIYNEAERINEWYEHHKELADEFVAVDTRSTDKTSEIIEKLPIRHIKVDWNHNFADANNFALRGATQEWILHLSPDFWIDKENFQKIKDVLSEKTDKMAFLIPTLHHYESWKGENRAKELEIDRDKMFSSGQVCIFKNDPKIYWKNRVHQNIHESIIENYGKEKIGILPFVRHHDSTNKKMENRDRMIYFQFLEDMAAIERKVWEHAQILRSRYYDQR